MHSTSAPPTKYNEQYRTWALRTRSPRSTGSASRRNCALCFSGLAEARAFEVVLYHRLSRFRIKWVPTAGGAARNSPSPRCVDCYFEDRGVGKQRRRSLQGLSRCCLPPAKSNCGIARGYQTTFRAAQLLRAAHRCSTDRHQGVRLQRVVRADAARLGTRGLGRCCHQDSPSCSRQKTDRRDRKRSNRLPAEGMTIRETRNAAPSC